MPTVLTGLVDTEDILADERKIDMDDDIKMLDPDESQYMTVLMEMGSEPAIREKVNWMEDELFPRLSAAAASATSAAVSLTVTSGEGSYFRAGDVVRVATSGECFRVDSVSTDTLTITRAVGDKAEATIAASAQLVIIGNAARQGATLGTRKVTKRVLGYNYAQIFRHPFGFTVTETEIAEYGGSNPMKEAVKKAVEHKRALEYHLFWGARDFITHAGDSNPTGYMGGAFEYISTNVDDVSGSLTAALLEGYMRDALQRGNKRKKAIYAAPLPRQAMSGFLRGAWQPPSVDGKKWGAVVDGYINGAFGDQVPVFVKRDWNDFSTASTQWGGWFFVIDHGNCKLRPLRRTRLLRNRQANDADEITHEYLTETSFQFSIEKAHAIVKGITG